MARSFSPRQWFEDMDWDENELGGDRPMWVYRQIEPGLWAVGFYSPEKEWIEESRHKTKDAAASRVRWLSGGNGNEAGGKFLG